MTAHTITWQEQQKANNLSDAGLTYRVKRRIDKWAKKTQLVAETKQAIADKEAEQQQYADKPNGHKYKQIRGELKDLNDFLVDTKAEVAELNAALCEDMDRLVRDAESNKKRVANLKGRAGNTSPEQQTTQEGAEADPPTVIPESITDDMKAELVCLNYTKEDIETMDPAQAAGILKKKKVKSTTTPTTQEDAGQTSTSTAASVPVMITTAMRQQLHALGYSKEDIDAMKPEDANDIIESQAVKPATLGTAASSSVGTNAPAIKPLQKRTEPVPANKKNQNAVLVGVGTVLSFVLGIFIGRRLK